MVTREINYHMKRILTLSMAFFTLFAFSVPFGIGEVASALKLGNANSLAKHFDSKVDITIKGKSGSYTKVQATSVLQSFFNDNMVKGFTIKHQGDNGGSEFCIGTLSTATGEFRTTFYLNKKADGQNLQEIRFE